MGRHRVSHFPFPSNRPPALDGRGREFEPREDTFHRDPFTEVVGARVRRLREELGWRQLDLAGSVERPGGRHYSMGFISRLERGYANPPLHAYIAIAEALGVEPGVLLGAEPDADAPSDGELTLIRALRSAGLDPGEALARVFSD